MTAVPETGPRGTGGPDQHFARGPRRAEMAGIEGARKLRFAFGGERHAAAAPMDPTAPGGLADAMKAADFLAGVSINHGYPMRD